MRYQSESPRAWRGQDISDVDVSSRKSYDYERRGSGYFGRSPSPLGYGSRDDSENTTRAVNISDEKVQKFDALLKRIETEKKRMSGDVTPSRRIGIIGTPRRTDRLVSASNNQFDYAQRARELRMSLDGAAPPRAKTPARLDKEGLESANGYEYSRRATTSTPRSVLTPRNVENNMSNTSMRMSSEKSSIMSLDGITSRTSTPKRMERGSSGSYDYSQRTSNSTPRSMGNISIRPSSSFASLRIEDDDHVPSSSHLHSDFKAKIEQFHSSLIAAHDTIASLENSVRALKRTVNEKDDFIATLERRNKSLNETLQDNKDEIRRAEKEKFELERERDELVKKHRIEIDELSSECEGYKKNASNTSKLSTECDEKVKAIQQSKVALENAISDKDKMIGSLRLEIKRLNEELADGSFVRANATRAEENAKKLARELEKANSEKESATKVIMDLEIRIKEKSDEADKRVKEKDEEIQTLKSQLSGELSMKQRSERMEEKATRLETELDRANAEKEDLADRVKDLEKRVEQSARRASDKNEETERLEKELVESKSRETELKRALEDQKRILEKHRERFENYDRDYAVEQKAVAALQQEILELEKAHTESNEEIVKLEQENRSLSKTLQEAEKYMLTYKEDLDYIGHYKSMLGELRDINGNLDKELREKEDRIRGLQRREAELSSSLKEANRRIHEFDNQIDQTIEASMSDSRTRIKELERQLAEKQSSITALQKELVDAKISSQVSKREVEELRQDCKSRELSNDEAHKKLAVIDNELQEKDSELNVLKTQKEKMLGNISKLEREMGQLRTELKEVVDANRSNESQLEKSQKESKTAWLRVHELEESMKSLEENLFTDKVDKSEQEKLLSELKLTKEKLIKREEQLDESKKGIAEAQKMIYKLMDTVQELRRRVKEKESGEKR